jgi:hypothetical protein
LGQLLVKALPIVIKTFSVVGTIALLLVSGGIFAHNIEYLHHILSGWPTLIKEFIFGVLGGIFALVVITIGKKFFRYLKQTYF